MTHPRTCSRSSREERGTALVVTMMALLLLSSIGAALVLTSGVDALIAENTGAASEAFYAADAGLERTLAELQVAPDFTSILNGSAPSRYADASVAAGGVVVGGTRVELNAVVNQANCGRTGACTEDAMDLRTPDRPWGTRNPRWRVFSHGWLDVEASGWRGFPVYVIVLIADDPAETDGDPMQDGAPTGSAVSAGAGVVLVRAEGFGRRGAHRRIEATVVRHDLVARARWNAADPVTRGDPPAGPAFLQVLTWSEVR